MEAVLLDNLRQRQILTQLVEGLVVARKVSGMQLTKKDFK
tara:strand:+ start:6283 stop:6402 length:120 start_codon:yes stop_codon:yes gene_type:complete